jgi:hypothetical protein
MSDNNVGHYAQVGLVAVFPGLRKFILATCFAFMATGIFILSYAGLESGGFGALLIVFSIGLFICIWLPATLLAMASRKVMRNIKEEFSEEDEE